MIISRCNTYIWSGRGQSWVTTLRCCYQYSQQVPPKQPPHRGDEEAPREPPTSVNSTPHTPPPSTWRKGVNIIKSFGQGWLIVSIVWQDPPITHVYVHTCSKGLGNIRLVNLVFNPSYIYFVYRCVF